MPAYNNYNAYGNYGNIGYANPANMWNGQQNNWGNQIPNGQPQPVSDYREYVHGRAGAEAYQLKPGMHIQVLWDDETDRFYVKGYDETGRPRVLADNDFCPHVEPEPVGVPQIDLSAYATKEDLKNMISEAFRNISMPNMAGYVTQNDLDRALTGLSVGNGGRIVRLDESNA